MDSTAFLRGETRSMSPVSRLTTGPRERAKVEEDPRMGEEARTVVAAVPETNAETAYPN